MVLFCLGTRPEIIKTFPVINEMQARGLPFKILFTGQHQSLYEDVKDLIPTPDFSVLTIQEGQSLSSLLKNIIAAIDPIMDPSLFKLLVVQGDTTTVLGCALSAFYHQIPIGHIEAGLRSGDLMDPYPEEGNRRMVTQLAALHWAPTQVALENLQTLGVKDANLTGNTIIDACQNFDFKITYENIVLITLHRRENFGQTLLDYCLAIEKLAHKYNDLLFIFPMHPNPNVQKHKHIFSKVKVVQPLPYFDLLDLVSKAKLVITDSGGIQEECAFFKKKVIVCRKNTERPEGIDAGLAQLATPEELPAVFDAAILSSPWTGTNPYGDGQASIRIVDSIEHFLRN